MFEVLEGIRKAVTRFMRGGGLYERSVEEFVKDLQRELIRADVNVRLVFELSRTVKERSLKEEPPPGVSRRDWFVKIVYEELSNLFGGDYEPKVDPPKTPWTILLVGVQGSGKTTTAGKLALFYSKRGYKVGLVSTDTYRPGAYEQLKRLAELTGSLFYGKTEGDPSLIALEGVGKLRSSGADIIIVDTAGRHGYGDEERLLEEMAEISGKVRPDEVALVLDAAMGQKAYELSKRFHESTPIGTIIVTKLDGTARGGGVISAVSATGARVKYVGTGEKLEELEIFRPKRFVARVLGLGDIESLIERVSVMEEARALEKAAEDMVRGRINMRTLYNQIKATRKMGPLSRVLQMIPGLPLIGDLDEIASRVGEEKLDRWMAIIESMTYEELDNPEIIDRSRIRRIAIGSGTSPEDVKELLSYYRNMKKMMKRLKRDKRLLRMLGI